LSTSVSPLVGGGGGATTPAVQLNSIFSAKTDPRESPEKTPVFGNTYDDLELGLQFGLYPSVQNIFVMLVVFTYLQHLLPERATTLNLLSLTHVIFVRDFQPR
jgi:hypothetical protein